MKIVICNSVKFNFLLFFFMVIHFNSFAQSTKDFHLIEVKKGVFSTKYFYNGQRFENPYGLQIPLMQVNDSQVTRDFNIFKNSMKTAKIINLISSGFSLFAFFNRDKMPAGAYWGTLGTAGAVAAFFNIRSSIILDRSVRRYNKLVSGTELGLQYDRTLYGNGILGVGISHKF